MKQGREGGETQGKGGGRGEGRNECGQGEKSHSTR